MTGLKIGPIEWFLIEKEIEKKPAAELKCVRPPGFLVNIAIVDEIDTRCIPEWQFV